MNVSKKSASKRDAAAHNRDNETFSVFTTKCVCKDEDSRVTTCDINQEVR